MIVGFFIIVFIIYRFLILERLPYQINEHVSWWTISVVVFILLTQLTAIINYVRVLRNLKPSKITYLLMCLLEYCYYKPLRRVSKYLLKRLVISQAIFDSGGALLYMVSTKTTLYVINCIYLIIPRFLLVCALLADIIILNKIHSFYTILWIGIISLTYQAILGLIWEEINQCKNQIEKTTLNIKMIEDQPILTFKDKKNTATFTNHVEYWVYCTDILDTITAYYLSQKNKYYILLKMVITIMFIFGWTLYLYNVLSAKYLVSSTSTILIQWLIEHLFLPLKIYW